MEALIKSPLIDEGTIELYPQLASRRASVEKKPHPEPAPTSARHEEASAEATPIAVKHQPIQSAKQAQETFPGPVRTHDPGQIAEDKLKELLKAQQASLKEAEAKAISEGFAKGLAEGQRKGEEQFATAARDLAALVESGRESVAGLLRDTENVIATIVFEAVCKIVGTELVTIEGCSAVIRQVLGKVSTEEIIAVRVSPKDHQRLKAGIASFPEAEWTTRVSSLPLESDDQVELGGCILSLKDGNIDGRIETQFRAFAQSLKDAAKRR